ncbi:MULTISPECIES: WXG100 family type VII secretion target [unclassified Saccharothrix]|uniref:WXG100 family type VII secretion target n=1 Tax=unclassified Saccharothrix TaxID=2593673 RepID=UPI00307D5090
MALVGVRRYSNACKLDIGLGVAGVGLEALSFVVDPLGSLLSAGVSWLIEHVKPLSDALDWLAGNADVVASHAATWKNAAKAVAEVRDDYTRDVADDTAGWVGQAGDAYRAVAKNNAEVLAGASTAADGFGSAVEMAGIVVAVVREVVRDLTADLVGRLISWAAEVAFTLGLATPVVVAQASAAVARWGAKIGDILKKLVRTISKLIPLLRKLGDVFAKVRKVLDDLKTPARSGDELPRPGQTCGARPVDDGSLRAYDRIDRWSENAYQSIRGSDDVDDVASHVADVPRVGGGTGFTRAEIEQIKNH